MQNEIQRLLAVLRFSPPEREYREVRSHLESIAWRIVRSGINKGFFVEVLTFPRWKTTDGMMEFALIHPTFAVTDDACLCLRINASPLVDVVARSRDDLLGSVSIDLTSFDEPTNELREGLIRTPLGNLLTEVMSLAYLNEGILWYGECIDFPKPRDCSINDVANIVINAIIHQPEEDVSFHLIV